MKHTVIGHFFFQEPMVTGDNFLTIMEDTAWRYVPCGNSLPVRR